MQTYHQGRKQAVIKHSENVTFTPKGRKRLILRILLHIQTAVFN